MHLALNTSTIAGHGLGVEEQIRAAAAAGYEGIEPWVRDLDAYERAGGDLRRLGDLAAGSGMQIINLIGFQEWLSHDPVRRQIAREEARRNFRQAARVRCPFVAAPPFGMAAGDVLEPEVGAGRLGELQTIADEVSAEEEFRVEPLLEFWGHSTVLCRLADALAILEKSEGNPRLLADLFHMHKRGDGPRNLKPVPKGLLAILHVNDFPASKDPLELSDSQRVFPGDGVEDWALVRSILKEIAFEGWLSLELFNREYYDRPLEEVLREGLQKSRTSLGLG